ncbi:MAG: hypothetical protein LBQ66_12300, partial [Planctomycetaceae bacterium]|nr:hypothetical protein [Planctomycetaceae bacterium]
RSNRTKYNAMRLNFKLYAPKNIRTISKRLSSIFTATTAFPRYTTQVINVFADVSDGSLLPTQWCGNRVDIPNHHLSA